MYTLTVAIEQLLVVWKLFQEPNAPAEFVWFRVKIINDFSCLYLRKFCVLHAVVTPPEAITMTTTVTVTPTVEVTPSPTNPPVPGTHLKCKVVLIPVWMWMLCTPSGHWYTGWGMFDCNHEWHKDRVIPVFNSTQWQSSHCSINACMPCFQNMTFRMFS